VKTKTKAFASFASNACLVPANGFYEWRREGKRKIPMHIVRRDQQPFTFAGLWDKWRELERGELYSLTIITTEANALLRSIHDRMPVIMDDLARMIAIMGISALIEKLRGYRVPAMA
jgi:putative SOS response-associated peptidase YedK